MRLQDFETHFDDVIVKRGYDYYKSGHVLSLDEDGSEWIAEVNGSEVYSVTAVISDSGEIVHTTCNCPYDFDEYCKHQAAVFFAIRDNEKAVDTKKKSKQKTPKQNLADVLGNLDKPELISILLGYAEQHKQIKEELLFQVFWQIGCRRTSPPHYQKRCAQRQTGRVCGISGYRQCDGWSG